jgi:arginine decarboxylase
VSLLTKQPPPLPDFSAFHDRFRPDPHSPTREGDLRHAFFLSYTEPACEYLTREEARERVLNGQDVVSAMFVTPYPPGFPVLVPGQVISADVIEFMQALDTREVHGYRPETGYRVFTEAALVCVQMARLRRGSAVQLGCAEGSVRAGVAGECGLAWADGESRVWAVCRGPATRSRAGR